MDVASLLPLVIRTSLVLMVVGLGLGASPGDVLYLVRRPALLLRSLLAMNVIVPLVAAALASVFALNPAIKIALVALAISPIPPALPKKQLGAGGGASYIVGLLVTAAALSIVFVPLALDVLGRMFHGELRPATAAVARLVAAGILMPLAVGLLVHWVAPVFAERISGRVTLVGSILLLLGVLPILITALPTAASLVGNGTLAALAALVLAGLGAGHLLGGPVAEHRVVLALAAASRHPGIALAIAGANFPDQRKPVIAAVVLYLIVSALLSKAYLVWVGRPRATPEPAIAR
jgi:BASS family bile acid:Na+ symporter